MHMSGRMSLIGFVHRSFETEENEENEEKAPASRMSRTISASARCPPREAFTDRYACESCVVDNTIHSFHIEYSYDPLFLSTKDGIIISIMQIVLL